MPKNNKKIPMHEALLALTRRGVIRWVQINHDDYHAVIRVNLTGDLVRLTCDDDAEGVVVFELADDGKLAEAVKLHTADVGIVSLGRVEAAG